MYIKTLLLASLFVIGLASCSVQKSNTYIDELSNKENIFATNNRLEQVANLWIGHFSNKATVLSGTVKAEQEVIGRRVWKKKRPNECWIYIGWFQAGSYEKALSGGLANIRRIAPDTLIMEWYDFIDAESMVPFEWAKDQPFNQFNKDELKPRSQDCGSIVIPKDDNTYEIISQAPCYRAMSDAVKYFKFTGTLSADILTFHTEFLNDKKEFLFAQRDNHYNRFSKEELENKYKNVVLTSN